MNYYDLRRKLLEINNDLTICYSLKLELVDFYSKSKIDNAKVNLENLICNCNDTNIEEMIVFSNNLINWKQEIINSFTIVGTEYKVEADKGQVWSAIKKWIMRSLRIETRLWSVSRTTPMATPTGFASAIA